MAIRLVQSSLVVQNLSSSQVIKALGAKIKPGQKVDLFKAIVGLTEDRVFFALAAPNGELYRNITKGVLRIASTTLPVLENAEESTIRKNNLSGIAATVTSNDTEHTGQNKERKRSESAKSNSVKTHDRIRESMYAGMSGDIMLKLSNEADGYITTSVLNDGYRSNVTGSVGVSLVTAKGTPHLWANFDLTVSVFSSVVDPQIADPTVSSKTLTKGKGLVTVDFDTDAGVTKVYEVGDYITITIKVSAGDTHLGFVVPSLTKTFVVT